MYIVLLAYKKPLEEIDKYGTGHLAFLEKYFKAEKFLVSGRQNPRTGGVIIAYNVTLEQLQDILQEDPFKQRDLADYSITEFIPVKYHDLFKSFITE